MSQVVARHACDNLRLRQLSPRRTDEGCSDWHFLTGASAGDSDDVRLTILMKQLPSFASGARAIKVAAFVATFDGMYSQRAQLAHQLYYYLPMDEVRPVFSVG